MAEESDQEKTEDPTERKLSKAREKGQVARSQEVSSWFGILALAIIITFFLPGTYTSYGKFLTSLLENAHAMRVDIASLGDLAITLLWGVILALGVPAIFLMIGSVLAGIIQTGGFIFSLEPIKPELSKIGFKRGLKKIFSSNSIADFVKGIIKISVVAAIVVYVMWPDRDRIVSLISLETALMADAIRIAILKVVIAVLVVMTVIAIADVVYQRYSHRKQHRMTKQEIKDEHKETEGDPQIKNRLRRIRIERARQRIMAAVPKADVVVTNPTHFSVALQYDQTTMEAPRLVAKGADVLAFKIRALAKEHKIPIVENPPLARALYSGVEIDQEVPPDHYKAVAELIGYVMRLHGKLRSEKEREKQAQELRRKRSAKKT
jgi:flagellar biosynthetic protein FlhB